ncbi:MAG: sigma-70 family RNA polymerase sigma factor [Opitutaceae bacterium]|nr:sigma-70 family RNA polymerase sigma factor [Opitutaceae bacterium]
MSLTKTLGKVLTLSPERQEEADADLRLVRQIQAGEVSAFDSLVQKYRERIYGVVYNLTSNREDAADLTQETFIKAFQGIARFQGTSSFFSWLYRIAINATLSHLRRHKLRRFFSLEKMVEEDHSAEVIKTLAVGADSDKEALVKELQEKLNEAFQKLSFKHRTVVTLFEIDQLSHQEIAEIMDCSVGTVRSRLHYAKQQLQAYLQDYIK